MPPADTVSAKVTADTVTLPLKIESPEAPKMVQVIVAPGRSLQIGKRQHAPNALVEIPVAEAADLIASGFVVVPAMPDAVPVHNAQMPSPTGPTINGVPGGVVKPA